MDDLETIVEAPAVAEPAPATTTGPTSTAIADVPVIEVDPIDIFDPGTHLPVTRQPATAPAWDPVGTFVPGYAPPPEAIVIPGPDNLPVQPQLPWVNVTVINAPVNTNYGPGGLPTQGQPMPGIMPGTQTPGSLPGTQSPIGSPGTGSSRPGTAGGQSSGSVDDVVSGLMKVINAVKSAFSFGVAVYRQIRYMWKVERDTAFVVDVYKIHERDFLRICDLYGAIHDSLGSDIFDRKAKFGFPNIETFAYIMIGKKQVEDPRENYVALHLALDEMCQVYDDYEGYYGDCRSKLISHMPGSMQNDLGRIRELRQTVGSSGKLY